MIIPTRIYKINQSSVLLSFFTVWAKPSQYLYAQYRFAIGTIINQAVGIFAPRLFISFFVETVQ